MSASPLIFIHTHSNRPKAPAAAPARKQASRIRNSHISSSLQFRSGRRGHLVPYAGKQPQEDGVRCFDRLAAARARVSGPQHIGSRGQLVDGTIDLCVIHRTSAVIGKHSVLDGTAQVPRWTAGIGFLTASSHLDYLPPGQRLKLYPFSPPPLPGGYRRVSAYTLSFC